MNEKKFEDALQELEKIVSEMESEGLGLDDSIKKIRVRDKTCGLLPK